MKRPSRVLDEFQRPLAIMRGIQRRRYERSHLHSKGCVDLGGQNSWLDVSRHKSLPLVPNTYQNRFDEAEGDLIVDNSFQSHLDESVDFHPMFDNLFPLIVSPAPDPERSSSVREFWRPLVPLSYEDLDFQLLLVNRDASDFLS